MGFRFRKSIGLGGGTRMNLSKSGIGVSAGVKGARASVNTSGRKQVSVGRGGMRYVKAIGGGRRSVGSSDAIDVAAPNEVGFFGALFRLAIVAAVTLGFTAVVLLFAAPELWGMVVHTLRGR